MTRRGAARLDRPRHRNEDGFILPHSLEAEKSCLGAALLYESAADHICGRLTADAFFRAAHRALFEAIKALRDRRIAVDLITVSDELERAHQTADVGGPAYITSLTDGMPRSANVVYYADVLRDLRDRRALVAHAHRTLDLVASGTHGADALLADADAGLMDLQIGRSDSRMQTVGESSGALLDNLEWRVAHRGGLRGVDTGFAELNALTGGWQVGELIVIGARPSVGKTSYVLDAAVAAARQAKAVAIFSLEMRRQQLEYRLLSKLSGVSLSRLLGGYLSTDDYQRVSESLGVLHDWSIHIDDRSGQTVWEIRSACRRLRAEGGLGLVVVDYVQLMPGTIERRGATRNEELTDISRRLKILADEVEAPVLALSQMNRASEHRTDTRPKLSDLRETGSLEQDADVVCFLHRQDHREGGETSFIVEKQRNGPTGTIVLAFDRERATFRECAPVERERSA